MISELKGLSRPLQYPKLERLKWAAARIGFHIVVGLSLATVVGGILFAPLVTWYMFDDWRFWRRMPQGLRLYAHGYRILGLMLRGEGGFMLGVPLFSPPRKVPVSGTVQLRPDWEHGRSCGTCIRCCQHGGLVNCPVLDASSGRCNGYHSFFWRYFNCGRFPTQQREIDYYGCPKWNMMSDTRY